MESSGFSTMKSPSVPQNEMVSYGIRFWSPVDKIQVECGVLVQFFGHASLKAACS